MIRNYIKTAFRSLRSNKGFTAINIGGLALGLAACLLIVFYVVDELSYDRYNTNADRIYRVNEDLKFGNNSVLYAVAMPPLADALKADFPQVENAVRIRNAGTYHIKKDGINIKENKVAYADPAIFKVFTLPVINGDAATALSEPNTIVLTETSAKKYFNNTNVVGKTLLIDDHINFKVTAVIKDIPKQSHFNFDFFVSMTTWPDSHTNQWLRSDYNTYVLLREGADAKKFESSLQGFLNKHSAAEMQSDLNMSIDGFEKNGNYFRLNLTPLTDIHLRSNRTGELSPNSTLQYVYIFSAIALFILIIACVNFMNLATARSANRAREVGVRKVLGSSRGYLVAQFLTESVMVTLAATLIACVVALLSLPYFNDLAGKEIVVSAQALKWLVPTLILIVVIVGALAGSYPAFYLSAFQPINVLKGKLANGFKNGMLRSSLVVFQFAISIVLIIGTLVIHNQLNYIQTKNLGYNREQVLIVQNAFELNDQAWIFKDEVKQLPGVSNATLTGFLPTSRWHNTSMFYKDATLDPKKSLFPETWQIDEDYISTLNMKMVAGRSFSNRMPTDSLGVIINETAAKFLDMKEPLNKVLYRSLGGKHAAENVKVYHIVGVVKDFHFSSLRENIAPVVMVMDKNNGALSIKVNSANIKDVIAKIEDRWKTIAPSIKMDFSFMDQDFDASYRAEQRIGQIFLIFTTLAIIIACLGLFGLAAYAAEQRTKEIGIRKILGASISGIVGMLSKDFLKLVFIAILIATPLAWYMMYKWLQDFAYRETIHWWVIAIAGGAAIMVAFLTISFQSIKAALINPVKSLRSE
ncbi:ABC transporter permease [Mucilaginibacter gynuensis]|uniref:ABC transporter permease n=1 Tax=Mucilaginibacter gynuensis TaxID=1302236 RepID=A0ABP8FUT5_9SPHI